VIIAVQETGSGAGVDALAHAILGAHWREDADIADAETLASLIRACGLDADAILTAASTDAIQSNYRRNTTEAIAQNIFGSPTYIIGGDPFYGQDRLELVERALQRPFAPSTWRNPPVD
jgi:2-hydroxychromene-2-carboxylate isomerase